MDLSGAGTETLVAWMHWDPNSIAFHIPIVDHPVRWYGILFVIGFAISYFIMARLLAHKLACHRDFQETDVRDWNAFVGWFQRRLSDHAYEASDDILRHLTDAQRKALVEWKSGQTVRPELKSALLRALTVAVRQDPEFQGQRCLLEELDIAGFISTKEHAYQLTDQLIVYVIFGTVIGARLGHIFFYDLSYYLNDPIRALKVWEGGLASHGGAIGIILALVLFCYRIRNRYPSITFLNLMDYIAICAGLVGACIRMGNFVNQEIVGKATSLPWAIVFGHARDGSAPEPRHPVQLYEGVFYLCVFGLLSKIWLDRGGKLRPGLLLGIFFTLVFTFRFFVEGLKEPMAEGIDGESFLMMGQWLSLPFIAVGLYLWFFKKNLQSETYLS
ncbi:MAG: prolipoprotein diacylglyceryl transferase [Chlamydiia bacterium]|nr:prolipoprotein diacylglyceryl transferase [Chlamydiia bacterium]